MPYKDKAVRNAKQRERYAADAEYRERMQASNKASYERNWDSIQAHRKPVQKAYRENHPDRVKASSKKWKAANRDVVNAIKRKSTAKNCPAETACSTYYGMVKRCLYPGTNDFHRYGGRGIKVCERWLSNTGKASQGGLKNFLADLGPRPVGMTLHRLCNDGDYEPGNCVWSVDHKEPCLLQQAA